MSLVVEYGEITRAVARRLGYPLSSDNWSTDETQSITDALRCGFRWFYFPTGENTHAWTFLRKLYTVNLVSGTSWYTLPTDFERFASVVSGSINKHPLTITNEMGVRLRISNENLHGTPEYCAVRTMQINGDTRYEIGVYPVPEKASTLDVWYVFDPGVISAVTPEPLGGATHGETILSACLAAAEAQQNPETLAGEGGVHYQMFQANLVASIAADRTLSGEI